MLKIPYECPECDYCQWIETETEYIGGKKHTSFDTNVTCDKCGHTDTLWSPNR